MKIAELFETPYQIDGPVQGDKLPVVGQDRAVKTYVDLSDKRIDLDAPQGPTIGPKISEIDQKNIIQNSAGRTIIVPKGAPDAGTWKVLAVSGLILTCVDADDTSPNPPERRINAGRYYVDNVNNDNEIHLEDERSRAEKYRVAAVDLGPGAVVDVVG